MAPKRKYQMTDKDQNKGKASKSHPTLQLARRLSEMTSQIAPCASSHALSHSTDLPAWTSDVIPPPSVQGVHSACTAQPSNPDAGCTLDVAPEKKSAILRKLDRQQMVDKVQNKGKASKSHQTKRLTRRVAMMTSEIPPCASSHAISPPTDPQPRSSEVIPPPSIQGLHSPSTSQPSNPDVGCTRDTATKRRSVRRKFVGQQMAEKVQNKVKTSRSNPTKQRATSLAPMTSQKPPYAAQPTNSMEGAHSPTRTSDVSTPPSMEVVHLPRSSQPTNSDAGHTGRTFVALETQSNDARPILYLDGQGYVFLLCYLFDIGILKL
ncbi:unnamed protein product [Sphenostylis stenocarpa]|uniref:Uncharacterized protein n=1 Tax=Sphenostylis stenocarpa TaxID=92480 RepID=A0AA86T657_9FABA|nr:unnamed protein product [Sphenostylis stenocarpa]